MAEYSKYLTVLLGFLAGYPLVWRRKETLGLKKGWQAVLLCICFSACSVLSALVFATLEGLLGGEGLRFGEISTYGVYLFCPIVIFLTVRATERDGGRWMDVFALYALPSLFLMRCNCLFSGCCGGRAIGQTGLFWPTREAEMVFYAVMFLVLLRREKRGAPKGTAFPLLAAAYGGFRFVVEWFRATSGDALIHLAHLWSVLSVITGIAVYFELMKRSTEKKVRH